MFTHYKFPFIKNNFAIFSNLWNNNSKFCGLDIYIKFSLHGQVGEIIELLCDSNGIKLSIDIK